MAASLLQGFWMPWRELAAMRPRQEADRMRRHGCPGAPVAPRCGSEPTDERSTVRDWMTRRPITVPEECAIERAVGQMRAAEIRHLVVVEGDRVTGIVSNRDLRRL